MRVRHKVNVVVTAASDGKDKLFAPDDALAEVILDGFAEVASGTVVLGPSESFVVPFGGVTSARGIYLRGEGGDFTVALNGGGALSVARGVTGTGNARADAAKVFLEALLTSATVTASTDGLTLQWVLWGDPVT